MDENNVFEPVFEDVPATEAPAAEVEAPVEPYAQPEAYAQPEYVQEPVYAQESEYAQEPVYTQEPVYVTPPEFAQTAVSPKSRKVALILAILLGELGINHLYLGLGPKRLIMGIISIFVWPLCIPCIIGAIKDIIRTAKGTMVDGQGLPVINW